MGKSRLRYLLTGIAALALIIYAFQKLSRNPAWQHFDRHKLWTAMGQVRLPEVIGAMLLIYLTYLLRSLRWYEFFRPVKRLSIYNLAVATVLGFGAVAVFGRPGELVRPYMISQQEDVPVSGQLAIWLLERFYDGVALILFVGAAIFLSGTSDDSGGQVAPVLSGMRHAGTVLMIVTAVCVTLLVLYERHLQTWEPWVLARLRFLPKRLAEPIRRHMVSFAHGLSSVRSRRALALGAAYSLLVWTTISAAFWMTLQALGPPIDDLNFSASMLVMGFAIAGSVIQAPGVGGGTQVFTIIALTEIYGVSPEIATSAALILWVLAFISVIPLAVFLSVREGLTWGKLRGMTKQPGAIS